MAQAAVTGAMDFARMDPRDKWWWRKLRWVLELINRRNVAQMLEVQHRHWVTLFSNASLDDSSFSSTKEQAQGALNRLMHTIFPWIEEDAVQASGAESIVSEFRELYGYPGDPRYEQMLADMMAAFKQLEAGHA